MGVSFNLTLLLFDEEHFILYLSEFNFIKAKIGLKIFLWR